MNKKKIREKRHRLSRKYYKGRIAATFTICLKGRNSFFVQKEVVDTLVEILKEVVRKNHCIAPVYCFMPDHLHLMLLGEGDDSDLWKTIVRFKQKTGFWLKKTTQGKTCWQKDFYDHILRRKEDINAQIRYILNNPVRKKLVSDWYDYPFKGSIGYNWDELF